MDGRLDMELLLNADCNLIAKYLGNYDEFDGGIINHSIVEFVVKHFTDSSKDEIIFQRCHDISEYDDPELFFSIPIELPLDGMYTYHRMLLPSKEHIADNDRNYFTYNNEVYFGTSDSFEKVTDYSKIWEDKEDNGEQIFFFDDRFFKLCNLNNCLLNLQRKVINNYIKNECDFTCDKNDSIRQKRDFLLYTIYILQYLSEQKRFIDAQSILEQITGCGDELCPKDNDIFIPCNCGKTL